MVQDFYQYYWLLVIKIKLKPVIHMKGITQVIKIIANNIFLK